MIRLLFLLTLMIPFVSLASSVPEAFKIQCEQYDRPLVFAYDKSKYPKSFLVGAGGRSKSMADMGSYDLESIERGKQGNYELISVYYTTNELNHYGEDKKILHKLTYFQDNSILTETVTLNKKASKLLSSSRQSSSSIVKISNCVSIGIW